MCRVGKEAGAGGVEVASIGTGQVKAEELDSPYSIYMYVWEGVERAVGNPMGGCATEKLTVSFMPKRSLTKFAVVL